MVEETTEEKTEKRRPVRKFFKNFVNVRRWIFYDEIKSYGGFVIDLAKSVFFPGRKSNIVETFEEAMLRFNLTEQDLLAKKKYFLVSSIVYLLIGIALVLYGSYLFIEGHLIIACVVLIMGLLMLVYAYRESFWYMQVSRRKLGCTFKEWYKFITRRDSV